MSRICIEGNIGSGKSTLLTKLCQEKRIPVFLEPVEEWKDWLGVFYQDPTRWGLSFNINVLLSFHKWKHNNFKALYERSPLSNRYVFCQLQYNQGKMTSLELDMFQKIYDELSWTPDKIIYIRTDPQVSMSRMQQRGRTCENSVSLEYITAVHNIYEELMARPDIAPKVVIIDGNKNSEDVYNQVTQYI